MKPYRQDHGQADHWWQSAGVWVGLTLAASFIGGVIWLAKSVGDEMRAYRATHRCDMGYAPVRGPDGISCVKGYVLEDRQ